MKGNNLFLLCKMDGKEMTGLGCIKDKFRLDTEKLLTVNAELLEFIGRLHDS